MNSETEFKPRQVEAFEQKKAMLLQEITGFQEKVDTLNSERKETDKHICIAELPK